MKLSRRGFVLGAALIGVSRPSFASAPVLQIGTRILDVKGKAAKVYGIVGPTGKPGLEMVLGQRFQFDLQNTLDEETAIHWHGLTPPAVQDGVPLVSAAALAAGETRAYDFENLKAGTHWMHSHLGLQEQKLLAAPLIVLETKTPIFDEQEHVVMLHDFTFREPDEILAELKADGGAHAMNNMPGMMMGSDVDYDAILANDRTLDDPEVLRVQKGGFLRLRIINAASATNMWIDLGSLQGQLLAVDGNTVFPVKGSKVPLGIAQRADIRIALPAGSGAWPILFQSEGATLRGGIIIQAGEGKVAKISDQGEAGAALDLKLESKLKPVAQLSLDPVTHTETVALTGGDDNYAWGFNGKAMMHDVLFSVRQAERVEVTLQNTTNMAHPMHLHGHYFKVVGIGGKRIDGAIRDTILVPAGANVTIQFDANNPGTWAFHCHHLYHMNSGMMATMGYVGAA